MVLVRETAGAVVTTVGAVATSDVDQSVAVSTAARPVAASTVALEYTAVAEARTVVAAVTAADIGKPQPSGSKGSALQERLVSFTVTGSLEQQ